MSERTRGVDDFSDYDDDAEGAVGLLDNGDPENPPEKTPGSLLPIEGDDIPTSEDLGGDPQ